MRCLPAHFSNEYVDAPADLFNYVQLKSQSLVIHSSQAINWLEKVQGLKLGGDRSIDCGSYEYLYLIE